MSGRSQKVYVPTNGVRTDFKRLMNIFLSSATVRYEQFSEVWRALNMSYLCAGRNSDRETREFVEKVLLIACEYFLPPYQFQVRVGGLYLLYAIYQIQPITPKAKIRMTPKNWDESLQFLQQAKLQSHLDVVYVFNRLIQEQAFQFCFSAQEMGPQSYACESEDVEVDLADDMKEEKSSLNKLFNYESMEQLSYLQDQYQRMKVALSGPQATKPDKSLNVVKDKMVEDIVKSIQAFQENGAKLSKRPVNEKSPTKDTKETKHKPQSTGSRRQELKHQVYSSSPSTRARSSSASPEKGFTVDRANRAAKRALRKSGAVGDQGSDDSLEEDSCQLVSPNRSEGKEVSAHSAKKRKYESSKANMPVIVEDDNYDDLTSDNGSDEDYEPPSKGRKQGRGRKTAFRKKDNLKESHKSSFLTGAQQRTAEKSSPKGQGPEVRGFKQGKAGGDCQQAGHGSGFRIAWSPVRNVDPSNNIDSPPSSAKTTAASRKSVAVDASSDSNYEFYMAPVSKQVFKNLGNNVVPGESTNVVPKKCAVAQKQVASVPKKRGRPPKQAAGPSTYEVAMAPTPNEFKSNIFFNAKTPGAATKLSTKEDGGSSSSHGRKDAESGNSNPSARAKAPVKFKDILNKVKQSSLENGQASTSASVETESSDLGDECGERESEIGEREKSYVRLVDKSVAKKSSTYKIVMAPTGKNHEELGNNAGLLPLQLSFPKAKLSHTIRGSIDFTDSDVQNSLTADGANSAGSSGETKQRVFKIIKTLPDQKCSTKAGKARKAPEQAVPSKKEPRVRRPRPSRYCTNFLGEEQLQLVKQPPKEPSFKPESLDKVFQEMERKVKITKIETKSMDLDLLKQVKEKVMKSEKGKWLTEQDKDWFENVVKKQQEQTPAKPSKVVLDSVKFI